MAHADAGRSPRRSLRRTGSNRDEVLVRFSASDDPIRRSMKRSLRLSRRSSRTNPSGRRCSRRSRTCSSVDDRRVDRDVTPP